jgi:hypothetical protein
MRPLHAKLGFSAKFAVVLVCAPLALSLGGCAAGAVAGAAVGTAGFAAKTTVKAGAVVVRGTGRAVGATARAIGGGGDEPR